VRGSGTQCRTPGRAGWGCRGGVEAPLAGSPRAAPFGRRPILRGASHRLCRSYGGSHACKSPKHEIKTKPKGVICSSATVRAQKKRIWVTNPKKKRSQLRLHQIPGVTSLAIRPAPHPILFKQKNHLDLPSSSCDAEVVDGRGGRRRREAGPGILAWHTALRTLAVGGGTLVGVGRSAWDRQETPSSPRSRNSNCASTERPIVWLLCWEQLES